MKIYLYFFKFFFFKVYSSLVENGYRKTQDYTIQFRNQSGELSFGIIKRFFYHGPNIFAIVHVFEKSINFMENFFKRKEYSYKFNEFYSIANLKKSCDVINIKQIISKCILLKDDNIFFISLCVDVNDHD